MKKILISILTILTAMIVMFIVIQNMPGNPIDIVATELSRTEGLTYEMAYERAKIQLNYDPDIPLLERFVSYLVGLSKGNLGLSMQYKKNVSDIILSALPWTFLVVSLSLFFSFLFGVLLGIILAWKRNKLLDTSLIVYQSIFGAIPNYVIAYLLVFLFSVQLGWFPARGSYSSSVQPGFNWAFISDVLKHAALPVLSYFLTTVATWIIGMKASSLSVLGEDYISYAKVRGLSNRRILGSYLTRNAILPMITMLAVNFGLMFGGSPLIENMFLYPGVGFFLNKAIAFRDYPLMQGMFLIIIIMVVLSSLFAEFLYTLLNPRLREK